MTITADFQLRVDEFIGDLQIFATGAYLAESEKDYWEAPFDVSAIPGVRQALENFLRDLDRLSGPPTSETLAGPIQQLRVRLTAINADHEYAVIEPEEAADIAELVRAAIVAAGASEEVLMELGDCEP